MFDGTRALTSVTYVCTNITTPYDFSHTLYRITQISTGEAMAGFRRVCWEDGVELEREMSVGNRVSFLGNCGHQIIWKKLLELS